MEKIRLNNTDYVTQIGYNAKGQRLLVAFGNGMMTRYVYDSATFRLLRLRSEKFTLSGNTYSSAGSIAQDTAYSYDAVGNILQTTEATTGCGIGGTDTLLRNFSYDSLYRLLSATGRENAPTNTPFWNDSYRSEDKAITTAYSQHFSYDKVGNILQLQHIGNNNFTRNFNYNSQNNQLQSIAVGQNTFAFSYDANGNVVSETSSRIAEFDYANRMRSFKVIASGSITQYTHYLYDGAGNRVKKLTITGSNYDSTTYIDGLSEYRTDGSVTQLLLHITDGETRIASVRSGDAFGDSTPAIKYMLTDHLSSVGVELNTNGGAVSREEYYAYGETSFGSYAKKRYRYCGKERDTESGYYFYNARYYNAWTCKFTAVDPLAGKYAHQSSYCYADCNPVMKNDPSGMGTGENGGENNLSCGSEPSLPTDNTNMQQGKKIELNKPLEFDQKVHLIDSFTGKNLASMESTENMPKGVYAIESYNFKLLQQNNFAPVDKGTSYEISLEKSLIPVQVDYEKISTDLKIAEKEFKKDDGTTVEGTIRFFMDTTDSKKYVISSDIYIDSKNTISKSYPGLEGTKTRSTIITNPEKIVLATMHDHPKFSSSQSYVNENPETTTFSSGGVDYSENGPGGSEADLTVSQQTHSPVFTIGKYKSDKLSANQMPIFMVLPTYTNKEQTQTPLPNTTLQTLIDSPWRLTDLILKYNR